MITTPSSTPLVHVSTSPAMTDELVASTDAGRRHVAAVESVLGVPPDELGSALTRRTMYPWATVPISRGGLGVRSLLDVAVGTSRVARADAALSLSLGTHLLVLAELARASQIAAASGRTRPASRVGHALAGIRARGVIVDAGSDCLRQHASPLGGTIGGVELVQAAASLGLAERVHELLLELTSPPHAMAVDHTADAVIAANVVDLATIRAQIVAMGRRSDERHRARELGAARQEVETLEELTATATIESVAARIIARSELARPGATTAIALARARRELAMVQRRSAKSATAVAMRSTSAEGGVWNGPSSVTSSASLRPKAS